MRPKVLLATLALLLLAGRGARAEGASVENASEAQWRAAQKTFRVGDELYDDGKYAEAVTAYDASYNIVASPNSRLQIARSLRELGKLRAAHAEFLRTIGEAEPLSAKDEKYAETLRAARAELEALEPKLSRVRIQLSNAPPGAVVKLNDRELSAQELAQPVVAEPGAAVVTATAPGHGSVRKEATLEAGAETAIQLELTAETAAAPPPAPPKPDAVRETPPPERAPDRTLVWVAGGVGVAGFATFGVFGFMNNSTFGDLEDKCANTCPQDSQQDIDAGRRYQLIANIGLAVGVVGIGTGAALFFLTGSSEEDAFVGHSTVAVGPGSIAWRGRF